MRGKNIGAGGGGGGGFVENRIVCGNSEESNRYQVGFAL